VVRPISGLTYNSWWPPSFGHAREMSERRCIVNNHFPRGWCAAGTRSLKLLEDFYWSWPTPNNNYSTVGQEGGCVPNTRG
jgi:hypothetical protein